MIIKSALVGLAALGLAACATVDVGNTQARSRRSILRSISPAPSMAGACSRTVPATVVKRFTVRIDCTWNGNEGTLDEHFEYADGTTQNRVWKLVKDGNRYTGTAADVVGTAQGAASGNALRWNYVLALPVDGRTWNMDMDDWMFLIDDRTMLNRTTMSKFGFRVGEVTLSFRKR